MKIDLMIRTIIIEIWSGILSFSIQDIFLNKLHQLFFSTVLVCPQSDLFLYVSIMEVSW